MTRLLGLLTQARCLWCGWLMSLRPTGRKRITCSGGCRSRTRDWATDLGHHWDRRKKKRFPWPWDGSPLWDLPGVYQPGRVHAPPPAMRHPVTGERAK